MWRLCHVDWPWVVAAVPSSLWTLKKCLRDRCHDRGCRDNKVESLYKWRGSQPPNPVPKPQPRPPPAPSSTGTANRGRDPGKDWSSEGVPLRTQKDDCLLHKFQGHETQAENLLRNKGDKRLETQMQDVSPAWTPPWKMLSMTWSAWTWTQRVRQEPTSRGWSRPVTWKRRAFAQETGWSGLGITRALHHVQCGLSCSAPRKKCGCGCACAWHTHTCVCVCTCMYNVYVCVERAQRIKRMGQNVINGWICLNCFLYYSDKSKMNLNNFNWFTKTYMLILTVNIHLH